MQAPRIADAEIAQRAYQIWEEEGYPVGRDQEHWDRAKAELEGAEPSASPDPIAEPSPAADPIAQSVIDPVDVAEPEAPAPKKRAAPRRKAALNDGPADAAAPAAPKKATRRKTTTG